MPRTLLSAVFSILALTCLSQTGTNASGQHLVAGRVVDTSGAEAANALVWANRRERADTAGPTGIVSSGPSGWVKVDSRGGFSLRLSDGRYKIMAKDEANGYPDPIASLNRDPGARFPIVVVAGSDVSDVLVVLGAKGGHLEDLLLDRETRDPIPGGKIRVQDARDANAYVEVFSDGAGHFHLTVPNKPVQISATAPGYREQALEEGREIAIMGGSIRNIVIKLSRQ
ncbi:MAG: carboxypeptidase-like regulatory domain-containing protein [Terriglobales bacterium]